jgi:hypothetical protein
MHECEWCGEAEPLVEDLPNGGQEIWTVQEYPAKYIHDPEKLPVEYLHSPCYKSCSGYYDVLQAMIKAGWNAETFLANVDILASALPEE